MTDRFRRQAPGFHQDQTEWLRQLAATVNALLGGAVNSIGSVTLTASATSTTLIDPRITAQTRMFFMPTTQSAATAHGSLYVSARTKGSATLSHASSNKADQTFEYVLLGG